MLAAAAAGTLLTSCAGEEPQAAVAAGRDSGGERGEESARASGPGDAVDPEASWVVAVTDKGGAFGFLGHQHAILVTDWRAEIDWRPDAPADSHARFAVPAASLRIDTERGRQLAGLGEGPDAGTVHELQTKMLDAEHLAAERHAEIVFEVTGVERGEEGRFTVEGQLTLRGTARKLRFPVEVSRQEGGVRFTGEVTVKQTDFGIQPESVAGVVKVADPVSIRFQVTTRPR